MTHSCFSFALPEMALSKMITTFERPRQDQQPCIFPQYHIHDKPLSFQNPFRIEIQFLQKLQCPLCEKDTKKFYGGVCFICFKKKAVADLCYINPSRCHFHLGTCREPSFGKEVCFKPHLVYLSYTDKVKVGLTKWENAFSRWADQGATLGCFLAKTTSRFQAGRLEKALTCLFPDKTHWQNMIKNKNDFSIDLLYDSYKKAINFLENHSDEKNFELQKPFIPYQINYPLEQLTQENHLQQCQSYSSLSLDKTPHIEGVVKGIKGQYLILEDFKVFHMRKHEGYVVNLKLESI